MSLRSESNWSLPGCSFPSVLGVKKDSGRYDCYNCYLGWLPKSINQSIKEETPKSTLYLRDDDAGHVKEQSQSR